MFYREWNLLFGSAFLPFWHRVAERNGSNAFFAVRTAAFLSHCRSVYGYHAACFCISLAYAAFYRYLLILRGAGQNLARIFQKWFFFFEGILSEDQFAGAA